MDRIAQANQNNYITDHRIRNKLSELRRRYQTLKVELEKSDEERSQKRSTILDRMNMIKEWIDWLTIHSDYR